MKFEHKFISGENILFDFNQLWFVITLSQKAVLESIESIVEFGKNVK